MRSIISWFLVPALVSLAVAAGPAAALTPEVKDEAGFFSPAAVEKANTQIVELRRTHHKDLFIETFKTIPGEGASRFRNLDREGRQQLFHELAQGRARQAGVNGVYVLLTRDPGHAQVEVGNETQKRAFTAGDRDQLRDLLLERFRAKEYDRGLLDAVAFVRERMDENLGAAGPASDGSGRPAPRSTPTPRAPAGGGWSWIFWVGLLILGIILVIAVFRWLSRSFSGSGAQGGYAPGGYGGYGPGYGGYGGGGGGFLSSLFGSLFGSAAGNWMYDRFFRGHPDAGNGWSGPAGTPTAPRGPEEEDRSYTGSGGDFDDNPPADAGGPELGGGGFFGGSGDVGSGLGSGDVGGGGGDFGGGGDTGSGGDF